MHFAVICQFWIPCSHFLISQERQQAIPYAGSWTKGGEAEDRSLLGKAIGEEQVDTWTAVTASWHPSISASSPARAERKIVRKRNDIGTRRLSLFLSPPHCPSPSLYASRSLSTRTLLCCMCTSVRRALALSLSLFVTVFSRLVPLLLLLSSIPLLLLLLVFVGWPRFISAVPLSRSSFHALPRAHGDVGAGAVV